MAFNLYVIICIQHTRVGAIRVEYVAQGTPTSKSLHESVAHRPAQPILKPITITLNTTSPFLNLAPQVAKYQKFFPHSSSNYHCHKGTNASGTFMMCCIVSEIFFKKERHSG